ncbi:MAG: polysaccharide pyruvyl transferase family protein, partial [Candidatus Eisenbacteria bacterium]
ANAACCIRRRRTRVAAMSVPSQEGAPKSNTLALLQSLRSGLDRELAPLIPTDRPVALLDFPVYGNVGDNAIWVGATATLRRLGLSTFCYLCSFKTYSRRELARRIGDGTILLTGGGNFGDLYKSHQVFREEVISSFPNNRIVQLPQSIWYDSRDAIERTRRVLSAHRQFTLMIRDRNSLEVARREFPDVSSLLCTDMAMGLYSLRHTRPPSDRVVWLSRTDGESVSTNPRTSPAGVDWVDWAGDQAWPPMGIYSRIRRRIRNDARLMYWLYGPVARRRLRRGIRILSGARCVVTDRLHGHIICLLLDIPHFLLPNRNGKIRAFYEAWTRDSSLVTWCENESEALGLADKLARHPRNA